jgi:hypothetical protein
MALRVDAAARKAAVTSRIWRVRSFGFCGTVIACMSTTQ